MDIPSNYFIVDQENPEKEEEDLRILNSIRRKKLNSKYSINKYEKFKPKPKIEIGKIDSTLLSADNRVKLLLSSFLHDLKKEQKKEKYINNINVQLKRKKSKILKKKVVNPNKNKSSNVIFVEIPVLDIKKINTISGNKYYENENQNNFNQLQPSLKKRRNSASQNPLFLNSYNTLNDNLTKDRKQNRRRSIDVHFNYNEDNLINDTEKNKNRINSSKKFKKFKIAKIKYKKNSKKSIKPVINSSLYLKFDLSSIIDEKLLKLTGDIREGMAIEKMLKEPIHRRSMTSNNNFNFNYCFSYFKNTTKNYNNNYCSNFSDKAKSESNSPKKDFFICNTNKIAKIENINNSQMKSTISNGKENFNEYIQRAKSFFSVKISPDNSTNKRKNIEISKLQDLKEQIRNTIILRPDQLNLIDDFDIINGQNKFISGDKEKSQRSKIYISSDNKNTESNLSNTNQSIDKKLNKNKFYIDDGIINNKINKSSDNFTDKEKNENQYPKKASFCSFEKIKIKKEIIKENFRILTYKRLIYDSFDDEEVEEEYNNKYIHPDSLFIKIFDNIVIFVAFLALIYMPYYLASARSFCKNYKKSDYIINIIVEIVYMMDFIFGFFKAYYNFEEQLITNNTSIIKKYLFSWFLLDLISGLPIYSYLEMKEPSCSKHNNIHPYNEIIDNLHYLIILNKLFKIIKVNFINHSFFQISNKLGINSTVLIELLILLSGLHFFSCLNIFIGRNSYPNWILESKLENKKFSDLYISSVYSIVASITTVGYGDIVCHSFPERIFQIFLLILGCIAYSWSVSSFSSYIQKNNEKSADFKNRKQILDEIKYNYPKMKDYLYERVLLYLKYKNCNEKRDKKMIFDCLPISLKNNLVYEMYKPIIKNFIFFKNFDNSDFIVRVILAFKPILAYKNDILLNEGDMVNDILFVKKGILSVQIPINIKNPEEYIDKYLYGDILEHKNQQNTFLNSRNQSIFEKNNTSFMTSITLQQDYKMTFLNLTEKEILFNKIKRKEEEDERKKNTKYIKILSIRQNEHFGDVLMFLDQRSPLRVKVTSKKAELFFLKKMDVIKISNNYQNIWKRINKRSVFNFEQIKKSIPKIVELYCKFKGFNVTEVESKISCIKSPKKKSNKRTMLPSTKLKMKTLIKRPKRSLTQIYNKRKIYINKYFPIKDDFLYEYKNYKTHVILNLHKNILNNSDNNNNYEDNSEEISENSNISDDTNNSKAILNKKLSDIYNRHYKYYIGSEVVKENYKTEESVIKEEPDNDSSIASLKKPNIIKNKLGVVKNLNISDNNIKKYLIKSNSGKNKKFSKKIFDDISQNKNESNSKGKKSNMEIINENDEIFHNINKSNRSNLQSIQKRKSNIIMELLEDENNNSLTTNSVNDEFDMNEEIKIPITESLMDRQISKSILLNKNNITSVLKINNLNKQNSEKIIYSNKSLDKDYNSIGSILDDNKNSQKNNNKLNNKKKKFNNENLISESIITDMQIKSIYNNLHSINNKYYLNENLQKMIKQLLEENIQIKSEINKSIKSARSIGLNESVNKFLNNSLSNTLNNNNNIFTNSPIKFYLKSTSLLPISAISKNRFKQREKGSHGKHSSTYTESDYKKENPNNSSKILIKKRKNFESNIGESLPDKTIPKKRNSNQPESPKMPKRRSHNIMRKSSTKIGFGTKDNLFSLNKFKNDMMISPDFFNKKRKYNLLSTIDFNIKKSSQNINNPNAFYSSYFQSLIENEKKNAEKFRMNSIDFSPKFKRNKK